MIFHKLLIIWTLIVTAYFAPARSVCAQTGRPPKPRDTKQVTLLKSEVMLLRSTLQTAIRRRDSATLERLYANDFSHTHAIGRVDDKATRIAALVNGGATIESVAPDEVAVRIYPPMAAVATGSSTLTGDDGKPVTYRWTTLYVKRAGRWHIAASHASRHVTN